MVEVTKPDYLSLVNKGGSGFNVSELVTSMVASEIEPKRILQNVKLEKTENAISGIGYLNSQAATTQGNFSTISGDSFFEVSSSNSNNMSFTATDEAELVPAIRTVSNVQIAKNMVFELPGFSLSDTFDETLTINFGEWTQSSFASDTVIVTPTQLEAGKTYKTVRADGSGASFDQFTRDPHDPTSGDQYLFEQGTAIPELGLDVYFRADQPFDTGAYDFQEVDNYSFTQKSGTNTVNINSDNQNITLSQMVALIDAVDGLNAQLLQKSENSDQYSVIVSSENTGEENAFKISSSLTGDEGQRWQTSLFTETETAYGNSLAQSASDLEFQLDGVEISRSQNTVTDLIPGGELNFTSDFVDATMLSISRSETAIRQSINDTIFSLNEFKDEIDRLTFIDIEGDENGPLALETAATMLKTNFKKLAIEPLVGYGSDAIYLSQLGIKTNSNGEYYLDETIFEKTLSNNPDYFLALKDANLSSNSASATVTKSQFTSIPAGSYTVSKDASDNWFLGDTALTQVDLADGGSQFTSVTYPGLVIKTADRVPAEFDVYVGKSFAQKMIDLMTDTLDLNSSLRSAEDSYKSLTEDIEARLEKLDEREKLISSRYTEQFGAMEQAMTQFNSTKSMLENFIESWKKQK